MHSKDSRKPKAGCFLKSNKIGSMTTWHIQPRPDHYFRYKGTHFVPYAYFFSALINIFNSPSRDAVDFHFQQLRWFYSASRERVGIHQDQTCYLGSQMYQGIPSLPHGVHKLEEHCNNAKLPIGLQHTHKLEFFSPAMYLLLKWLLRSRETNLYTDIFKATNTEFAVFREYWTQFPCRLC